MTRPRGSACWSSTDVVGRAPLLRTRSLGDVLTLGGDFFGAEEAFNAAGQTPGFEARVASGLARVYARLGRYRDMATQLRRAAASSSAAAP